MKLINGKKNKHEFFLFAVFQDIENTVLKGKLLKPNEVQTLTFRIWSEPKSVISQKAFLTL